MVTDQQLEESLNYLSDTDEEFAKAKKNLEGYEKYVDLLKSQEFLESEGNVEERKSSAKVSEKVKAAQRKYLDALEHYEIIKNKRDTAQIVVWIWRSLKSSERVSV